MSRGSKWRDKQKEWSNEGSATARSQFILSENKFDEISTIRDS